MNHICHSTYITSNAHYTLPIDCGCVVTVTRLICMIIINVALHTATVVLNSSVGMRGVCPGETVTYTCTVIQGIGLDWIVEPFISGSTRI